MKTIRTARIWVFVNGAPVKLSLRGQTKLNWTQFTSDEEGWSRTWHQWTWNGETLTDYHTWRARDCDGTVTDSRLFLTTPGSFRVRDAIPPEITRGYWNDPAANPAGVLWPEWHEIKSRRRLRDFNAEAANY